MVILRAFEDRRGGLRSGNTKGNGLIFVVGVVNDDANNDRH